MTPPPVALHNARGQGVLRLQWADGWAQSLSHAALRAACPCSQCRARGLRGGIGLVVEGVRLQGVVAQGYGVQLLFDDGHQRGIYPWAYLRALQP